MSRIEMSTQPKASRICVPVTEMQYWPDYTYESNLANSFQTTMCSCGLTSSLCSRIRAEDTNASDGTRHMCLGPRIVPHVFMTLDRVKQER